MTVAQNELVKHFLTYSGHHLKQSHGHRHRRHGRMFRVSTGRFIDTYEDAMNTSARWRGCVVRALLAQGLLEWRGGKIRLTALSHHAVQVR